MRTVRNHFLEAKTARDIDAQVSKLLRGLGNPTGPIDLADVRELLKLDRHYYSSQDDSALREFASRMIVAGKQVVSRPTLIVDVFKKFNLQGLWIPDRKRVLINEGMPKPKWRWTEAHELIHSVIPWHDGAVMGDDEYSVTPSCHEQVEAEANYGAGRLLFLQGLFDEYVKSSSAGFGVVESAKEKFGNTLTTTFWRVVETLEIPALGVIGKHPHHDRKTINTAQPFRYFIRSKAFAEQFSSITESDTFAMIKSYCEWKKRGPLGAKELVLKDDVGDDHVFLFETFSNTHDVLTLVTYANKRGVQVAQSARS